MEYPLYDIGDIIRLDHPQRKCHFLVTGFDRDGDYEVLCLHSNKTDPLDWHTNETGELGRATLERFGEKVV